MAQNKIQLWKFCDQNATSSTSFTFKRLQKGMVSKCIYCGDTKFHFVLKRVEINYKYVCMYTHICIHI